MTHIAISDQHQPRSKRVLPSTIYVGIFAACLSGCAALKGNVTPSEPKDGPRAQVRVVIPSVFNNYRGVRAYPNSICTDNKLPGNGTVVNSQVGFEKSLNDQKIGVPATPFSNQEGVNKAEFYATANKPIAFRYLIPSTTVRVDPDHIRVTPGCIAAFSFVPKAEASYELVFDEGSPTQKYCRYTVSELTGGSADRSATPAMTPVTVQKALECEED